MDSSRRLLPYNTTLTTDRQPCPGGIWTRNPSKWAATDPRLRPSGHWGRLIIFSLTLNVAVHYARKSYLTFVNSFKKSDRANLCRRMNVILWSCSRVKFGIGFRLTLQPVSRMADPRDTSVGVFINVDSVKLIAITLTLDSYVITSSLRSPVKSTSVCDNRVFKTKVSLQTFKMS
jgi:hypothetical protein